MKEPFIAPIHVMSLLRGSGAIDYCSPSALDSALNEDRASTMSADIFLLALLLSGLAHSEASEIARAAAQLAGPFGGNWLALLLSGVVHSEATSNVDFRLPIFIVDFGASIFECRFSSVDFRGSIFDCRFSSVDFRGSIFEGRFSRVDFLRADFSRRFFQGRFFGCRCLFWSFRLFFWLV